MATKMAGSVHEVRALLDGLLAAARPAQERELSELAVFAAAGGHAGPLDHCDVPYWRRKWLRSEHRYDEDTIREYFPLPTVLAGTFALFGELFGIRIEQREAVSAWHADVQFYDVFEENGGSAPIAGFYLDLYARDADKLRQRQGNVVGVRQRDVPLAALVFDFAVPLYGKPSLLGATEVRTLCARFGHAMQHLLTRAQHSDVAGWSNIEWDAVGVSGEVAAGLVRGDGVLERLSGHFASGEQLPVELRRAVEAADRHMAGWALSQELYVAALDVELHVQQRFWLEVVRELWPRYQVLGLDKRDGHPCGLTEVVSGSWAAAYFGHVWSRVVAADVCSAFEEARTAAGDPAAAEVGVRAVGQRYRETFLALGGARHSGEVFRQFRGRDPSTRALLRQLGLEEGCGGGATTTTDATAATEVPVTVA